MISIHAPTRGATQSSARYCSSKIDFNPRSHERSDTCTNKLVNYSENFNPRSHERSDSAPAPAIVAPLAFQSTLPREERPKFSAFELSILLFQSTLPREERLKVRYLSAQSLLHFNPRSHERSDKIYIICNWYFKISIHAPTRGATIYLTYCLVVFKFQSTLPREERPFF